MKEKLLFWAVSIFKFSRKTGGFGKHNVNFKIFTLLEGFYNSSGDQRRNLVLYSATSMWRYAGVNCRVRNEELVFDVNEAFGKFDHFRICTVD